jgi:hypothetical protein
MNLAGGNWEIGHTDHPGTTVQVFAAAVIFIQHLFNLSHPLYKDVILNPERYLFTCSVILFALFVIANYLTGAYILRRTGSIGTAMLFQLIPLININIVQRVVMLGPESFIIIVSPFLMAYLYVNLAEDKIERGKQTRNLPIVLGVISAFLIVTKYTCMPVVLLVLFMLKENRQRLKYLVTLVIGAFIFLIPALPKFKIMFTWIWNLLTHDGIYGKGQQRMVDPSQFIQNLKGIFVTDTVFTTIYVIISLAFIISVVQKVRRKEPVHYTRVISGIWVAITTLIIAVAKHCDFHYLIFAECCYPLGLLVSYKIMSYWFMPFVASQKMYERKAMWIFFSMVMIFLVIEKIRYMPLKQSQQTQANQFMADAKSQPLVISVKDGLACDRMEPGLYLGLMYSGNMKKIYAPFLKETYPNTYIYWAATQTLNYWGDVTKPANIIGAGSMLLYLKGYNEAERKKIAAQFTPTLSNDSIIYNDEPAKQDIHLISKHE